MSVITARQKQLEADVASIASQAKAFAEKSVAGTLTEDESTRFDELVIQLNAANKDLDTERTRSAAASAVLEANQHYNQPATQRQADAMALAGGAQHDPSTKGAYQTPGERFVRSSELKRALELGGSKPDMKQTPVDVVNFRQAFQGEWKDGLGPDEIRSVIYSGSAPASALLAQVLPSIYRALEAPLVMRDVLLNFNTNSDNITVMQETAFTNNAAETGEATTNNTDTLAGGLKVESGITLTETTFPVRWIAHWMQVTRQLLEDLAFMRGYIDERLLTGLARREDYQILNGTGVAPNLTGLLATSGIQTLDAAYFAGTPVYNDAGTNNENLNRLRRAKTKVMVTGAAMPTFIAMNPVDLEKLDTVADSTRQYLLGGPLQPANRRIWGLQVVETQNIAAGTALVGDGTMAAVVDRSQSRIYTADQHSDYFIRNLFVILAEERIALPVFRAAAFAKTTLV